MAHSKPKVTITPDSHRYIFVDENIEFILERFSQNRDGIWCEMIVNGIGGQLKPRTRTNLLAEQTVSRVAGTLEKRTPNELGLDWGGMLTVVAATSIERYRAGDTPIDLMKVSGWKSKPRYLLHPFIESSGDTIVFADGGAGKSTFALMCAVTVSTGVHLLPETRAWQTGNVLYLDWEADEETHAERLQAIRRAFDPLLEVREDSLIYKRMYAAIDEAIDELRGIITKYDIILVIIDSLGRARGGAPEAADETIKTFAAIRRLLVPTLIVDHMSKEAVFNSGSAASRPIGSTYTHNNARLTWSLTAGDAEHLNESWMENGIHTAVRLTNHKNNNGRLNPPRTYSLQYFTDQEERLDKIFVDSLDPSRVPDFVRMMPVWKRARMHLEEHGPATTDELATALNAKKNEIEANLSAHPTDFYRDEDRLWQLNARVDTLSQQDMFDQQF